MLGKSQPSNRQFGTNLQNCAPQDSSRGRGGLGKRKKSDQRKAPTQIASPVQGPTKKSRFGKRNRQPNLLRQAVQKLAQHPSRDDEKMSDGITHDEQLEVDLKNMDNDIYCAGYVTDIIEHLRGAEAEWRAQITVDYMQKVQQDVKPRMRSILVDWMVEVHNKFKLRTETVYLTIDNLDRYLSKVQLNRSKLQLLGCTCMWVASKYHEIYAPEMKDFVYISDNAFSIDDLLEMETELLCALDFQLTVPTAWSFAERFIMVYSHEISESPREQLYNMTQYFIEHALMTYDLVGELRSKIASAALYAAIRRLNLGHWNQTIQSVTKYSEEELKPLADRLQKMADSGPRPGQGMTHREHKAVVEKYSKAKYGQVATVQEQKVRRARIRD